MIVIEYNVSAQATKINKDSLENLVFAALNHEKGSLFVHFDKTIYIPNETIWFNAYFLYNHVHPHQADVLYMTLIKDSNRSIYVQKKFSINGAVSAGSMLIPDSLPEGDYSILTYSNLLINGRPDPVFTQRISIKNPLVSASTALPKPSGVTKPIQADIKNINLSFYPEGGNLIANLPGYIGWEARDLFGAPVKLRAIILKDNELIDTIETSAFGMGKFVLNPKVGSRYEVKVIGNKEKGMANLPTVFSKGVTIAMPLATACDTLCLKVASTLNGKLHVVVHNGLKAFYALSNIEVKTGRIFKIALNNVPKGLATVTILNENLQAVAERVFFAHYDQPSVLTIVTDSTKYAKKQKVKLSLSLNTKIDTNALLSVAVVQRNRIDRRYFNDIENYQYIARDLTFLPAALIGGENTDQKREYLENVLLVRGWRKYVDTVEAYPISRVSGVVTKSGNTLKKPMILTLLGNASVFFVNTNASGEFTIENPELMIKEGENFGIFATGDEAEVARIRIDDPFLTVNQSLAKKLDVVNRNFIVDDKKEEPLFSFLENTVQLNAVNIKGKKDLDEYHARPGVFRKNPCGDYICQFGGLNCIYQHGANTGVPVNGQFYNKHVGLRSNGWIIANVPFQYQGCSTKNKSVVRLNGINSNREFYPYSEKDFEMGNPLYNSTLYWKPDLNLKKGKPAQFSFYTGDVAGRFSIIVQGITDNGVVYSESNFEVIK